MYVIMDSSIFVCMYLYLYVSMYLCSYIYMYVLRIRIRDANTN